MKTVWTAGELRDAYAKRGNKTFVVKTSDGSFYDLNDRLLAKMNDYYAIYETKYEVQVSRVHGPPPVKAERKNGFALGDVYHT